MASKPTVGERAPWADDVQNQRGEAVKLGDLQGRHVVLYFYPKDDTPGCSKEACGFRDHAGEVDATVLGVSLDDADSHRAFAEKFELPFDLLVDPDGALCRAYGVLDAGAEHPQRATFLIDPDGAIKAVWPEVDPDGHWDEVRQAIAG